MAQVDVHITAGPDAVKQPWIWRLSKDFNVKVNIVKANVDADFGWMEIQLEGPVEEVQRGIAFLLTTGLHVEAQQRAVTA